MNPCAFALQCIPCSPPSNRIGSHSFSYTTFSLIDTHTRWRTVRSGRSPSSFRRRRCETATNFAAQSSARGQNFSPGTTALLLQISEPARDLCSWTQQWLREYIFSAKTTLTVPVSLRVDDKQQCQILFYASDSTVRGLLLINAISEGEELDTSKLRITSSSRFVNAAGTYTSTLPGERRIVRDLYSAIAERFDDVRVLYKPKYIRLRKYVDSQDNPSAHATVLVCEVRGVSRTQVVSCLHDWAFEIQFSATGLFFNEASLPPIFVSSFRNGVKIRSYEGPDAEIIAHVRTKGTNVDRTSEAMPRRAIVVASATYPNEKGTRVVLKSLRTRLLGQFTDSRIHTAAHY